MAQTESHGGDGVPVGRRASFESRGFLDPVRIFSPREARGILARLERDHQRSPLDWQKGWAAAASDYHAIAAHDDILDRVIELLGQDVLLWGASLVVRRPNQVHWWHTDIESSDPAGGTVSVWIGLSNTTDASSLKAVPYSHGFGVTVQQVMQEEGLEREGVRDEDVARWARLRDRRSGVMLLAGHDGDAVFFDGRLWHGSHNRSQDRVRHALLLQYATPHTAIRIPNFGRPGWPFKIHRTPRPACVLVSGSTSDPVNRIVPAPVGTVPGHLPALSSQVHALQLPLEQLGQAWTPHDLFRGTTPNFRFLSCHVSVLAPGARPHPPHEHPDDEILMILDGEADLIVQDGATADPTRVHAERGAFSYYPAGFSHTIENVSRAPVTYLMFKWTGDRAESGNLLGHRLVSLELARRGATIRAGGGFEYRQVLEGQTRYCRRLHAHLTIVQPGAGYEPHIDAHDVGVIVLEGAIETLGERVGPHGVVFYAAGEPHGLRNAGEVAATYMVFEFHGRHRDTTDPAASHLAKRVWRVLRSPRRLRDAIRNRVASLQ